MHFNPYGGPAAELAAALVNAHQRGVARADAATVVRRLFEEHNRARTAVTTREAVAILDWSARLSPAFGERDVSRLVDVVNGLLRDSASRPYISTHDGRAPHIHYASEDDDEVTRTKAFTAAGLAHVVSMDPARLGRCDSAGCVTVYVDTSRNGRRRFCSTRCATRVHVADHRGRASTGGARG
jgi:predicted RNA-binding Zn ribbon-like protein